MPCHIQVPVTECKKSIVAYDGIISIHWGLNIRVLGGCTLREILEYAYIHCRI